MYFSEMVSTLYPKRLTDRATYLRRKFMLNPQNWLFNFLYPKIWELGEIEYQIKRNDESEINGESPKELHPGTVGANFALLDYEGYFLIDNGDDLIFLIHEDCGS
jgi:hypothetical protein